ncbi:MULTISPECIES: HU family DNA-binding protein, partial [unclassified Microcoleus]
MNKKELVEAVADKTEVSQKTTSVTLNAVLETIIEALASGDKVTLVGFGTFESRDRKARQGRNPKTGEPIQIAAG